ncbi:hypothetical protein [Methylobacter svalbardensis]|uniref:hypothetical protein n=1 Tax=Methylobacter svalbardensis TaxID=3080016 RepID=UPI0030EE41DB
MFIYSLPLFFTHIGLASPLELLIIFVALFATLFIISLFFGGDQQKKYADNYLLAAWNGGVALKWAFWSLGSNGTVNVTVN